ncbi:MAG: flavin reductase family protein [Clostridia bacterium]|nr:flavin reductase family protein [Clostridia bacterium]
MARFTEITPEGWQDNVFERIGRDWMLITAGDRNACNTMTASWGGAGVLWNKNVTFAFVRPSRYTYEFLEKSDAYSLSFLGDGCRKALQLCGSVSGRDRDKIAEAGLTVRCDESAPYFEQAEIVLVCRKLYVQDIDPSGFLDESIQKLYPSGDYHRVYVGEITKILKKET